MLKPGTDEVHQPMSEPNDGTGQNEVCGQNRQGVVGRAEVSMPRVQLRELVELLEFVLDEQNVGSVEVGLHVVDAASIAVLNQQHMGIEGSTDVLSFPIYDEPDSADPSPRMLGEVVLCPEVAERSARVSETGLADELRLLVVHGTLHLLGMDHAARQDRLAMAAMQNDLREKWADRTGQRRPEPVHLEESRDEDQVPRLEVKG